MLMVLLMAMMIIMMMIFVGKEFPVRNKACSVSSPLVQHLRLAVEAAIEELYSYRLSSHVSLSLSLSQSLSLSLSISSSLSLLSLSLSIHYKQNNYVFTVVSLSLPYLYISRCSWSGKVSHSKQIAWARWIVRDCVATPGALCCCQDHAWHSALAFQISKCCRFFDNDNGIELI